MDKREEFLQIKTKEEYLQRREEFREVKLDYEVLKHLGDLCGKAWAPEGAHMDMEVPDIDDFNL